VQADDRHTRVRSAAAFGAAGLAALVGARLFWAIGSPDGPLRNETEWSLVVDPAVPGFWSVGGFVGGGLVALAVARGVQTDRGGAMLDRLVPAGLLTLAAARLGCLSAGCDFGRPTALPWGLQYPAGSPAWEAHLAAGQIGLGATASAPTHPFPLYMVAVVVAALLAGAVVSRWRAEAVSSGGARAFTVLLCYFGGRFAVEFFRASSSAHELAGMGLTVGQWFSASSVTLLVVVWWSRIGGD